MTCEYLVERAAANLPQSAQAPLFTVSGGRVFLLKLVPEVTTVIQNQSDTTSVVVNPTTGSDITIWSLGSIEDRQVGTIWGNGSSEGASVVAFPSAPFVVPIGTIDLSCSASNTGQIKWTLLYAPLDPGAKVTAA